MLLYLAQEKLSALVLRIIEELLTLIILNDPVRVDKEFPIGHGLVEGSLHFRNGSGPVFSARSSDGPLPGVELTETGESGPMTVDLPLSGVLQS